MSVIGYEDRKNHFSPAGDLEDESFLNEIIMESYEDGLEATGDTDIEEGSRHEDDIEDEVG